MMDASADTLDGYAMNYPYDLLTAACLFIIVVSTSIMLALS
ncbi:hypothetical protein PQR14_05735 [Paraburkholderia bryophila]|nr:MULTISPECIES: hypothetical protein [Burkholderiaceae]